MSAMMLMTACGFDPEEAREESEVSLQSFLDEYEHNDTIVESDEEEDVIEGVEESLGQYFTTSFSDDVSDGISNATENRDDGTFEFRHEDATFFLRDSVDNVVDYYGMDIDDFLEVNEEQENVYFSLETDEDNSRNTTQVHVEMSMEDEEWKINEVNAQ